MEFLTVFVAHWQPSTTQEVGCWGSQTPSFECEPRRTRRNVLASGFW